MFARIIFKKCEYVIIACINKGCCGGGKALKVFYVKQEVDE
jgi:hypothetical protein